jgi:hypothetical protein
VAIVGIIANPASGKDIRRLVAHGSVFDNNEKVNIVRRVLLGIEAAGVTDVLYMPDYYGIVDRAYQGIKSSIHVAPLEMRIDGTQDDSTKAARLLAEAGAGCVVTLGGDGTNRAVAKGSVAVPFMPISTGTNNVFPFMVEGTLAGLAAGLIAGGAVEVEEGAFPTNRVDIVRDGEVIDLALVDAAVYDDPFIASRAVWDMGKVRALVLARAKAGNIGLSSIGGGLECPELDGSRGVYIRLDEEAEEGVDIVAPVAPGIVANVRVAGYRLLDVGDEVGVDLEWGVLALDGEREVEVRSGHEIAIRFSDGGPRVVDVNRTLQAAAQAGHFSREPRPADATLTRCFLAYRGVCLHPCDEEKRADE